MSKTDGRDNPAFINDNESYMNFTSKTSQAKGQEQNRLESDNKSENLTSCPKNGQVQSFVSQRYIEPIQVGQESCYKIESRIELPVPYSTESPVFSIKMNGVHGNGNDNDVSFLNNSVKNANINIDANRKEQIEAVNLELISMGPYTAASALQIKSPEACEVPTDPYEEYFVPVNEHRKYIRGEKLCVTKDKRSRSSYWRRLFCWSCSFFLLSVTVIISILAATGVLLTQKASLPLVDKGGESFRQFEEIHTAGSKENIKDLPPSPPPATSTFPPWTTTSEAVYQTVPNALSGMIRLNNLEWNKLMRDSRSLVYREVADEIENNLKNIIRLKDNKSAIKVYEISDPAEVRFRVSQPLLGSPESAQKDAEINLRQNGSRIGKYNLIKISMNHLKDECQIENGGCIEICQYDYLLGVFSCACSEGKTLDKTGKVCLNNDLNNKKVANMYVTDTKSNSDATQSGSRLSDEILQVWEYEHPQYASESKPSAKPKSSSEAATIFTSEHKSSMKMMLKSQTTAGPQLETESIVESKLQSETAEKRKSMPQPMFELKLETVASDDSKLEPEISIAPILKSILNSEIYVQHVSNSEPKIEDEHTTVSSSVPESTSESQSESSWRKTSKPASSTKLNLHLKPATEPQSEMKLTNESHQEANQQSKLKPTFEPNSEAEKDIKSEPIHEYIELKSESKISVELKSELKNSEEPSLELEPSTQSTSKPDKSTKQNLKPKSPTEPETEPESHTESIVELESSSESKFKHELSVNTEFSVIEVISSEKSLTEISSESPPAVEMNLNRKKITLISVEDHKPILPLSPTTSKNESFSNPALTNNEHNVESVVNTIYANFHEPLKFLVGKNNNNTFNHPALTSLSVNYENTKSALADIDQESKSKMHFDATDSTVKAENASFNNVVLHFNLSSLMSDDIHSALKATNDSNFKENILTTVYPKLSQNIGLDIEPLLEVDEKKKETEKHTTSNEDHSTEPHTIIPQLISKVKSIDQNSYEQTKVIMNKTQPENATSFSRSEAESKNHEIESSLESVKFQTEFEKSKEGLMPDKDAQDSSNMKDSILYHSVNLNDPQNSTNNENSMTGFSNDMNIRNMPGQVKNQIKELNSDFNNSNINYGSLGVIVGQKVSDKNKNETEIIVDLNVKKNQKDDVKKLQSEKFDDTFHTVVEGNSNTFFLEHKVETSTGFKETDTMTISTNTEISIGQINKKREENADDQYNDINDESVQKSFEHFDVDTRIPIKMSNYSKSVPTPSLEIQQEISLAESAGKTDSTVLIEEYKQENLTLGNTKENIKEVTTTPTEISQLSTDSKSTEVPILPEELQTTEVNDSIKSLTSSIIYNLENNALNSMGRARPDDTVDFTVTTISSILHVEINKMYTGSNSTMSENKSDNMQTSYFSREENKESTKIPEEGTTNVREYITTTEDVRPVSESVLDDIEPMEYDYRQFFIRTTTEVIVSSKMDSLLEEELREKDQGTKFVSTKLLGKNKPKKESETDSVNKGESNSYKYSEQSITTPVVTEDLENNSEIEYNSKETKMFLPKLKTVTLTYESNQTTEQNISMLSENNNIKYPTFIPVVEEIDESDTVTKPTLFITPNNLLINTTIVRKSDSEDISSYPENTQSESSILQTLTVPSSNNYTFRPTEDASKKSANIDILSQHSLNSYFSKCTTGQFQCVNGTSRDGVYCVNLSAKCDSESDCSDGSDELNCEQEGCRGNFKCSSGQCLKRHLVCNGIVDCDDGTDEEDCENWRCKFDEFRCPSGF